ncbi:MAG TPA: DUF4288 domain-containing protein [Actinomycetota bacterium]
MKWFTAVLVLECLVDGASQEEAELQFRLVRAPDQGAALAQAERLGKGAQESYQNHAGEGVTWVFRGLFDLAEIDGAPSEGSELYSMLSDRSIEDLVRRADDLG